MKKYKDKFIPILKPKAGGKAYYLQALRDIKMFYELSTIKGCKSEGLSGIKITVDCALKGKPLFFRLDGV